MLATMRRPIRLSSTQNGESEDDPFPINKSDPARITKPGWHRNHELQIFHWVEIKNAKQRISCGGPHVGKIQQAKAKKSHLPLSFRHFFLLLLRRPTKKTQVPEKAHASLSFLSLGRRRRKKKGTKNKGGILAIQSQIRQTQQHACGGVNSQERYWRKIKRILKDTPERRESAKKNSGEEEGKRGEVGRKRVESRKEPGSPTNHPNPNPKKKKKQWKIGELKIGKLLPPHSLKGNDNPPPKREGTERWELCSGIKLAGERNRRA